MELWAVLREWLPLDLHPGNGEPLAIGHRTPFLALRHEWVKILGPEQLTMEHQASDSVNGVFLLNQLTQDADVGDELLTQDVVAEEILIRVHDATSFGISYLTLINQVNRKVCPMYFLTGYSFLGG